MPECGQGESNADTMHWAQAALDVSLGCRCQRVVNVVSHRAFNVASTVHIILPPSPSISKRCARNLPDIPPAQALIFSIKFKCNTSRMLTQTRGPDTSQLLRVSR